MVPLGAVQTPRRRPQQYWMLVLFNIITAMVLAFIEGFPGLASIDDAYGPLTCLYALGVLIPGIAVSMRRLHDTGRSGRWLLMSIIPFANSYRLLLMAMDNQSGPNEYGPNPKTTPAYA